MDLSNDRAVGVKKLAASPPISLGHCA